MINWRRILSWKQGIPSNYLFRVRMRNTPTANRHWSFGIIDVGTIGYVTGIEKDTTHYWVKWEGYPSITEIYPDNVHPGWSVNIEDVEKIDD
jgi:hypothetical protein